MAFARRTARRINEFNNVRWRGTPPWTAAEIRRRSVLIEKSKPDLDGHVLYLISGTGLWGAGDNLEKAKRLAFNQVLSQRWIWTTRQLKGQ